MSVALGRRSLSLIVATLLAVSAVLFVTGVVVERTSASSHAATESGRHTETGEEHGESGEQTGIGGPTSETSPETVLGIAVESPLTVTLAVLVSLLLAGAVWLRPPSRRCGQCWPVRPWCCCT